MSSNENLSCSIPKVRTPTHLKHMKGREVTGCPGVHWQFSNGMAFIGWSHCRSDYSINTYSIHGPFTSGDYKNRKFKFRVMLAGQRRWKKTLSSAIELLEEHFTARYIRSILDSLIVEHTVEDNYFDPTPF